MTKHCCLGLDCTRTDFVKAHIVPRGFARLAQNNGKVISIEPRRVPAVAKHQHGIFDGSILCESCDGKLGRFDDYAIEFCKSFPKKRRPHSDLGFKISDVDTDSLRKGILAILWRASISTLPGCANISLGAQERKARNVLFGLDQLNQFPEFQIVLQQYTDPFAHSIDFYTLPYRRKFDGLNVYLFGLVGLRFLVKIDARPFPHVLREWVIGDDRQVIGTKIRFDETLEGRALIDIAKTHRGYRTGKRSLNNPIV